MKNARVLSPTEIQNVLPQLRALADAGVAADDNEQFSDQTWVELRGGSAALLVVDGEANDLAGAAAVVLPERSAEPVVIEMLVAPAQRGTGVGSALAKGVAELVTEQMLQVPGQALTAWNHGGHPAGYALAEKYGLSPTRILYRMALEPEGGQQWPVELPEGVMLRTFIPDIDDADWLTLNAAAFASHPEQGKLTQADLDARMDEEWFDATGFFIAEREADEKLLGFHWTKFPPEDTVGEVYAVGVSPDAQGLGLGRALTAAGMNFLVDMGATEIVLYVDDENTAAVKLYNSLGFAVENTDVMFRNTPKS